MEQPTQKIEQIINTAETERQECLNFIITVKNSVLATFPFTTEDEKKILEDKFDSLLNNNDSDTEVINNIKSILASLENTHTLLKEKKEDAYYLEKSIFYKANKYWIENDNQILEVVNLNGLDINELIYQKIKKIGGGTVDYKINRALKDLLISDIPYAAVLEVKNKEGQTFNLKINYTNIKEITPSLAKEKFVDSQMLDEDIGYLKINTWSSRVNINGQNISDLVEDNLKLLASSKSLIIDVRKNSGGDSKLAEKLAGHFITQPIVYGTVLTRELGHDTLVNQNLCLQPQGDYLDKKLVILTGPECLSSNEMFIMMLKDTNRAITVGQTTGGGSGSPKSFDIHLGKRKFTLNIATWKMRRNNGSPLENIGIEPDLPVITTPDDVIQYQDPDLKKAIEYVHSHLEI